LWTKYTYYDKIYYTSKFKTYSKFIAFPGDVMRIYNTLTREYEEFKPLDSWEVKMYVCGPTVYDYAHLGHGRTYVAFDVIRRYLEHRGNYTIKMVLNFTDIDDKIINRANETKIKPEELADKFIKSFLEDMNKLNIKPADIYPRVSEHIDDVISFIKKLEEKGYAYKTKDGVYFDVRKFKEYGKLSNINLNETIAGYRVEKNIEKKNPEDFALWKFAKPNEPKWDSPWGEGRPAWHIECSAMGIKYLGEQFDIHGGGNDLIFPHHENEIAQSEVCTGKKPWVKYWLHTGFVMVDKEKMSKSLGNFITLRDLFKKYPPEVIRFFLLQRHYRSPLDYSEEGIQHAKNNLEKLYNTIENIRIALNDSETSYSWGDIEFETYSIIKNAKTNFYKAMDNDFNTPEAIKSVFEVSNAINRYISTVETPKDSVLKKSLEFFIMVSEVFGIFNKAFQFEQNSSEEELVELLISIRSDLRKEKNYKLSDKIRDELKDMGIQLEDTPKGVVWRKINI
jgi:cysteinyl-tRNA synthetase